MERITISIEESLAQSFDALIAKRGYASRSEAMRDLVREALEQERLEGEGQGDSFGVLTYVFNHHERDLAGRITRAQHEHQELAVSTLHIHVDHDNCLEAVVLHGQTDAVRAYSEQLCASTGVRYGRLHLIPGDLAKAPASEHGHTHSDDHHHD